jgi:hypothetical protein
MDGDKENLLEGEIPPGMELPETFPFSLRNLDTDPFLRIQVRGILSGSSGSCSLLSVAIKMLTKRKFFLPSFFYLKVWWPFAPLFFVFFFSFYNTYFHSIILNIP